MMDTLIPKGHIRPKRNEFKEAVRALGFRARWNDGGEGTPLPEGFDGGEGFSGTTVEELGDAYKASSSKTFVDYLGDGAKDDESVKKYKTGEDFYKGYKHASEMVGKKGVIVPPADATQEQKDEFLNALGRPVIADEYKFTPIEGAHESSKFSPEFEKTLKDHNYSAGLTQAQADANYKFMVDTLSNAAKQDDEAKTTAFNEATTKLRGEMGHMYEGNVQLGKKVIERFGGAEALTAMKDVGNDPSVIKMFTAIGKSMSEDSIKSFGASSLTTDSKGAESKIREIMGNKDHPYHNEGMEHKKAVREMTELHKIAYGGGAQ